MKYLNKDLYSEEIQQPCHVHLNPQFISKIEKCVKQTQQRFDKIKKKIANQTYFSAPLETDIEYSDKSLSGVAIDAPSRAPVDEETSEDDAKISL